MSSISRIALLTEAMNIETERAVLEGKLGQMQARLVQIKSALISGGASTAAVTPLKAAPAGTRGRSARGELKQRIFQALAAAGAAGMRVRDLAVAIGSKSETLHSWFQFARKSIPAIRKAGKGRYRYVGRVPKAAPATAKTAPKPRASAGNQRGQLAGRIHAALKAAGKAGARVGDLAKKFAMDPRNLFVWFSTTGKKFKAIKKVAPGHYRIGS